MIEIKDPNQYFKLLNKMSHIGLEQSEYWYKYKNNTKNFVFYVDSITDTAIAILGVVYKIPFFGNILRIQDGPVYEEQITQKKFNNFFSILMQKFSGIEIDSTHPNSVDFEVAIRRAGFLRSQINKRCPLTVCIDPKNKRSYSRIWRRNLKKANTSGVQFRISNKKDEDISTFVELFAEMKTIKNISYKVSFSEISSLLSSDKVYLFFAFHNDKAIAGRIISIDKSYGFDIHAANSELSRDFGASFFLMDKIFEFLSKFDIKLFDFGRIAPGKTSLDNVSLFKESSRGIIVQYNGEWVWYNSALLKRALYYYYNYFLGIHGY